MKDYSFSEVIQKNGYMYYGISMDNIVQFDKDGEVLTTIVSANPSNLFVRNNTTTYFSNKYMYSYDDESVIKDSTFREGENPNSITVDNQNDLWIKYSNKVVWMDNLFKIKKIWDLSDIKELNIYNLGLSTTSLFLVGTKSVAGNNLGISLLAFQKGNNGININDNVSIDNISLKDVNYRFGGTQYGGSDHLYVSHNTKIVVKNNGYNTLKSFYIHYRRERVNLNNFCAGAEEITKRIDNLSLLSGETVEIDLGNIDRANIGYERNRGFNFCVTISAPNDRINNSTNDNYCKFYEFDPAGIVTSEIGNHLQLHPNPAKAVVHVVTKFAIGENITITNSMGQEVLHQLIFTEFSDCNVATLPKGLYIIAIRRQDGTNLGQTKLAIE